jgi:hypothetical protein
LLLLLLAAAHCCCCCLLLLLLLLTAAAALLGANAAGDDDDYVLMLLRLLPTPAAFLLPPEPPTAFLPARQSTFCVSATNQSRSTNAECGSCTQAILCGPSDGSFLVLIMSNLFAIRTPLYLQSFIAVFVS